MIIQIPLNDTVIVSWPSYKLDERIDSHISIDIHMLFRAQEHTNMHNTQPVGEQTMPVFTRTVCGPAVFVILFTVPKCSDNCLF